MKKRRTIASALALMAIYFFPCVEAGAKEIGDLKYSVSVGLLASIYAKELCSCHFVSGLPLNECLARSNLNSASQDFMKFRLNQRTGLVHVETSVAGQLISPGSNPSADAQYDFNQPRNGCRLIRGPIETGPHSKS